MKRLPIAFLVILNVVVLSFLVAPSMRAQKPETEIGRYQLISGYR